MPPSSVAPIMSLGLGSSTSTGGTSLVVALAGLGELCCKAEGRNEDRVANMTAFNERGRLRHHKSAKYRYGRVVLEYLDVRQEDRLDCKATSVEGQEDKRRSV